MEDQNCGEGVKGGVQVIVKGVSGVLTFFSRPTRKALWRCKCSVSGVQVSVFLVRIVGGRGGCIMMLAGMPAIVGSLMHY